MHKYVCIYFRVIGEVFTFNIHVQRKQINFHYLFVCLCILYTGYIVVAAVMITIFPFVYSNGTITVDMTYISIINACRTDVTIVYIYIY